MIPPHETLEDLLETAQQTDILALRTQLNDLVSAHPSYAPFAKPILQFASKFMVEEIEELLQQHLTERLTHAG